MQWTPENLTAKPPENCQLRRQPSSSSSSSYQIKRLLHATHFTMASEQLLGVKHARCKSTEEQQNTKTSSRCEEAPAWKWHIQKQAVASDAKTHRMEKARTELFSRRNPGWITRYTALLDLDREENSWKELLTSTFVPWQQTRTEQTSTYTPSINTIESQSHRVASRTGVRSEVSSTRLVGGTKGSGTPETTPPNKKMAAFVP